MSIRLPYIAKHTSKDDLFEFLSEEARAATELRVEELRTRGCEFIGSKDHEDLKAYHDLMIDAAHSLNNMEKQEFLRRPIIAYRGSWDRFLRSYRHPA